MSAPALRIDLRTRATVPASWASAGIADALAFSVGRSTVVHDPIVVRPNRVSARCGLTAPVVESDRPLAHWRNAVVDCPTCLARAL